VGEEDPLGMSAWRKMLRYLAYYGRQGVGMPVRFLKRGYFALIKDIAGKSTGSTNLCLEGGKISRQG